MACPIELFRIAKGKKAGLRAGECVHFVGFDSQARYHVDFGRKLSSVMARLQDSRHLCLLVFYHRLNFAIKIVMFDAFQLR